MPPNQIESLSRSAGSPALPTAMTTRPQLASSPAIAVFTSGELAIDMAMRRAEAFDVAPSTTISTSLRAPSPSRAICSDRLANTACRARLKSFSFGSAARPIRGFAGGKDHQGVGGRRVAVDGYRVEGVGDAVLEQRLQSRSGDGRISENEG